MITTLRRINHQLAFSPHTEQQQNLFTALVFVAIAFELDK